ncbi:MAG TPA: class I SAM-dependent methyltransferase [Candidatus Dormibacteraeota bacterium]
MTEDPRTTRVRRFYERGAERYDRGMALFMDRLLERGRRRIGERASGRVLEVGIGTGATLPFYDAAVEVVGVDLSPAMLAQCRARALELGRPLELVEHDAQQLPFEDASFDTVVFTLCLCTIPDPGRAIGEGLRVVRAGGRLLFLEHVRPFWPLSWIADAVTLVSGPLSEEHFNRRTEAMARRAGVELGEVDRWAFGFLTLMVGCKSNARSL